MSSLCLLIFAPWCLAQNTLLVAAAADLSNLQAPLTQAFRKFEPNTTLRFVITASGALSQQIENGAPYDVFLSANAAFIDKLASNGKIQPDSVTVYTVGQLGVLWKDGKHHPLKDLAASSVRIVAVPNGKLAPYGLAAQQALEHEHLWDKIQSKLVFGENVRQTYQFFESGNADAVITSVSFIDGKNSQLIPAEWHKPIIQKAGIVAASSNVFTAKKFLAFLTSPEGQAIFRKSGFRPLDAPGRKPPANP